MITHTNGFIKMERSIRIGPADHADRAAAVLFVGARARERHAGLPAGRSDAGIFCRARACITIYGYFSKYAEHPPYFRSQHKIYSQRCSDKHIRVRDKLDVVQSCNDDS